MNFNNAYWVITVLIFTVFFTYAMDEANTILFMQKSEKTEEERVNLPNKDVLVDDKNVSQEQSSFFEENENAADSIDRDVRAIMIIFNNVNL